jgi:hypothetical protein
MNCQDINSQLLVKLIRLKKTLEKNLNQPESFSNTRSSTHYEQQPSKKVDIDTQVDISFPSSIHAPQIDMEIIEMTLILENLKVEKKLNESENEYFRRVTIQLGQINGMHLYYFVHKHILFSLDIEKLLSSLIPFFNTNDIKFKRTKQLVDRTSFVLKTLINNKQDKISEGRVKLYIALLVGSNISFTINDLSTINEQVFLIQCDNDIGKDFLFFFEKFDFIDSFWLNRI